MTIPKFRAWLKEEKRMTDVHEMTFIDGEVYLISDITGFYAYEEFKLMQSTGLKDKNGNEIFEGDIIKFSIDNGFCYGVDEIGSVSYRLGVFHVDVFLLIDLIGGGEVEVIGNVYETKGLQDLLKD